MNYVTRCPDGPRSVLEASESQPAMRGPVADGRGGVVRRLVQDVEEVVCDRDVNARKNHGRSCMGKTPAKRAAIKNVRLRGRKRHASASASVWRPNVDSRPVNWTLGRS